MWGVNWALEVPLCFAIDRPGFAELPTIGRSNAFPIVAEEVEAVRTAAGAYEIAQYARYEVTGPGSEAWLDRLLASTLPEPGRIKLAPMLGEAGRLMGDLSVTRLAEDRWWLTGSVLPAGLAPAVVPRAAPARRRRRASRTSPPARMGFSVSGPASRAILARLTDADVSDEAFPFMAVRELTRRRASDAVVGRLALTGELGYEIVVPARGPPGPVARARRGRAPTSACARSATTPSTACAWRRATGSGTPSSPRSTRPGWRAWTGTSPGTSRGSSGATRRCASARPAPPSGSPCSRSTRPTPRPPATTASGSATGSSGS